MRFLFSVPQLISAEKRAVSVFRANFRSFGARGRVPQGAFFQRALVITATNIMYTGGVCCGAARLVRCVLLRFSV